MFILDIVNNNVVDIKEAETWKRWVFHTWTTPGPGAWVQNVMTYGHQWIQNSINWPW